jgi:hypothetical protein
MMDSLEKQFHHAMIGVADFANQHNFSIRFRHLFTESKTGKIQSGLDDLIGTIKKLEFVRSEFGD